MKLPWLVVVSIVAIAGCDIATQTKPPTPAASRASAGGASEVESSKLAEAPKAGILFQPRLVRENGRISHNGTASFARAPNGKTFAMTCAHFLDFEGPALKEVVWLDVRSEEPVARMSKSWGPPGDGGKSDTQRVIDLRSDYLLLPVDETIPDDVILDLDPRRLPEIDEPIWFPDKDPDAESGYQLVTGKVVAASPQFHTVELDRRIKPVSQSGSPIISQRSGKVLGIWGRVMMFGNGKIHLYLVPSRSLLDRLGKEMETPSLQDLVGRKGAADVD